MAAQILAQFGEAVEYQPKEGATRDILAVVDREQIGNIEGMPSGTSNLLIIEVANDTDAGISADELDTGFDKVELPIRIGDNPTAKRITEILGQDSSMLTLELR